MSAGYVKTLLVWVFPIFLQSPPKRALAGRTWLRLYPAATTGLSRKLAALRER